MVVSSLWYKVLTGILFLFSLLLTALSCNHFLGELEGGVSVKTEYQQSERESNRVKRAYQIFADIKMKYGPCIENQDLYIAYARADKKDPLYYTARSYLDTRASPDPFPESGLIPYECYFFDEGARQYRVKPEFGGDDVEPRVISKKERSGSPKIWRHTRVFYLMFKDAYLRSGVDIPFSFLLTHSAIETGWGRHRRAYMDNNLFGRRGSGDAGSDLQDAIEYDISTKGYRVSRQKPWALFTSWVSAIRSQKELLSRPRYIKALDAKTAHAFFSALHGGGYGTQPDYVERAMRVYETVQRLIKFMEEE